MKHILKFIALFVLSIGINICSLAQNTLTLATGSKNGDYYQLGQNLKTIIEANNPDIEIIVLPTHGSVENAKLIEISSAHLALIQSDIAFYFHNGERMFFYPSDNMEGIASLYTEAIQVIAGKDTGIEKIEDLRGKTIALGLQNSGAMFNATIVLNAYNITLDDINAKYMSFENAKEAIINGEIDATFFTSGIFESTKREFSDHFNIIPINTNIIERISRSYPCFLATSLPMHASRSEHRERYTLGVRALLVANKDVNSSIIYSITETIFNNLESLRNLNPIAEGIDINNSLLAKSISVHNGSKKYYIEQGLIKVGIFDYYKDILSYFSLLLILFLFVKFRKFIFKQIQKNIYVRLIVVFLIIFIIGTIGMYFFERKVQNENFLSLYESVWSSTVYLLSGFEDRSPITIGGRIMSVFILISSIILIGSVAGNFASIFLKKEEIKMKKNFSNHIIICNWHNGGDAVLSEILSQNAEPDTYIIVITTKDVDYEGLLKVKPHLYNNVYFLKGDPTQHKILEIARVDKAKGVVILADDQYHDPDANSALIALAIRTITDGKKKTVKVVAESINHRKIQHIKDAGVDEVICVKDYGISLLAQCSINHYTSEIYERLLKNSEDSNEFYFIELKETPEDVKKQIVGKHFHEVERLFNKNRTEKNAILLIGYKSNSEEQLDKINDQANMKLNPKKDDFLIKENDTLIVIAHRKPNLANQLRN